MLLTSIASHPLIPEQELQYETEKVGIWARDRQIKCYLVYYLPVESLTQYGYIGLFLASFLAATILPLSSEIVLVVLLRSSMSLSALILVATIGNTAGSVFNYWLGRQGEQLYKRCRPKAKQDELDSSIERLQQYGNASLLFAWAPVIGDPLTIAAGFLRVHFLLFLVLVATGKLGRYLIVAWGTLS